MKKETVYIVFLVAALIYSAVIIALIDSSSVVEINENYLVKDEIIYTALPEDEVKKPVNPPFLGKTINGFKEALAYKESRGNYFAVNDYGYLGKYQFSITALRAIGIYNTEFFLKNPDIQEKAFIASLERNKWRLRKEIEKFSGKKWHGVTITESGILAAAHLAGNGNVKKYLRSWGKQNFRDANGASVHYYIKKFSGYDLSPIKPDKEAKI